MLSCVDMWLDNCLNNVPETAICFHREGVVQGYQLVPTDQIQYLSKPAFEPQLMTNNAASVLHFLQDHCTKEGGTYRRLPH